MLIPALHFPGNCMEVIAFYKEALNAELLHVTYNRDAPTGSGISATTETRDTVMHAELIVFGTRVNMCDVVESVSPGNMFVMNVFLDSADDVTSAFQRISEGGKIVDDLAPQFWTSLYGQVVDRFGVHWQLMTAK